MWESGEKPLGQQRLGSMCRGTVRAPGNVWSHGSPELMELKCECLWAEGGLLAQPSAVDLNKQHSTVREQCLGLGGL